MFIQKSVEIGVPQEPPECNDTIWESFLGNSKIIFFNFRKNRGERRKIIKDDNTGKLSYIETHRWTNNRKRPYTEVYSIHQV